MLRHCCPCTPQAVDKSTLLQLRGSGAKGYAFDRRYGQDEISDRIYDDVVGQLVESCFKVRVSAAHTVSMLVCTLMIGLVFCCAQHFSVVGPSSLQQWLCAVWTCRR